MAEKRTLEDAQDDNEAVLKAQKRQDDVKGKLIAAIRELKVWSGSSAKAIHKQMGGNDVVSMKELKETIKTALEAKELTQRKMSFLVAADPLYPDPTPRVEILKDTTDACSGVAVKKGDVVTITYKGTLESDGSEFDAGEITFVLDNKDVIAGFDHGVLGMKVGSSRSVKVPPELGYGRRATTGIPAGSTLLFDISLIATGETDKLTQLDDDSDIPDAGADEGSADWEHGGSE